MRPSRIKELINEEIRYAFAKDPGETIDIDDMIDGQKKSQELKQTLADYQKYSAEYAQLADAWRNFASSVALLSDITNDLKYEYIERASDSVKTEMQVNLLALEKTPQITVDEAFIRTAADRLMDLRRVHEELKGDIFTYRFPPIQAEDDQLKIKIDISKKGPDGSVTGEQYKQLTQTVKVSSGWKISAGLGLAFSVLQDQTYSYSVIDDAITADELDDFTPALASFAHIYKQTPRDLNFGLSFGMGIPLFTEGGGQSAAFFLGPTVLLGTRQKFLISAGFTGARVNRLAGGYAIGDTFVNSSNTLPMNNKYELGYFIGISYDILN